MYLKRDFVLAENAFRERQIKAESCVSDERVKRGKLERLQKLIKVFQGITCEKYIVEVTVRDLDGNKILAVDSDDSIKDFVLKHIEAKGDEIEVELFPGGATALEENA